MRLHLAGPSSVLVCLLASLPALAVTIQAGPGLTFTTPCAAVGAAKAGDTVEVQPGTYTDDSCTIPADKQGLTVLGVLDASGKRPKMQLTQPPSNQKGIFAISAGGVTIQNMELTGAQLTVGQGSNGAGIRIQAPDLTVRNCYIHDNQDGILGYPTTQGGKLLIDSTELYHNGMGTGCTDGNGCTHNVYAGNNWDSVTIQYSWSHQLSPDNPTEKGHLFKSRAPLTYVLYSRFTGETDTDSYELDFPNGGTVVVVGNIVQKPLHSGNGAAMNYGEEGMSYSANNVYVVNNTFVSDMAAITFIKLAGGTLVAHNNLFVGAGATPSGTGALSADNLLTQAPKFVDQANYDYRLTSGSPGVGQAVAAGSAQVPGNPSAFSLVSAKEYSQPLSSVPRPTDKDLGAYELGVDAGAGGTSTGGEPSPGSSSGSPATSSSSGGAASSSSNGQGGAGSHPGTSAGGAGGGGVSAAGAGGGAGSSEGTASNKGGCGCGVATGNGGASAMIVLALGWIVGRRRGGCRRAA